MNEADVVDAVSETISGNGWRLAKHVTTVDLEREERKLVLTLVRSDSQQQELPLGTSSEDGDDA